MRIIAGIAGSVPLKVPRAITRPTTDRVREAVFSVLGDAVIGARVLDLFAGSGSLGIEALSRGASEAVFVESHAPACTIISENLKKARLCGGLVQSRDVATFLTRSLSGRYDIIFADPPYARDEATHSLLEKLLHHDGLAQSLVPGGLLVLESFASVPLPEAPLWSLKLEKTYGSTRVSYLAAAPSLTVPD